MDITGKSKPVKTIPEGVWEASRPTEEKEKSTQNTITTDLQGNGYPVNKQSK